MSTKDNSAKIAPDKMTTPQGKLLDKVEVFGWEIVDKSGRFQKISKKLLNVDHDYQRDVVKHARINRIANSWSWARFGILSVARRPDDTFWVFDGQHRKLAADKRSDIDELPCMVFTASGPVDEAKMFLDVNCDRGTVGMLDRFKALVTQNDPIALAVRDMLAATGHVAGRGSCKTHVRCLGVLMLAMKADRGAAQVAWDCAVIVCDGVQIIDRVYQGLLVLERHLSRHDLGSLGNAKLRPFLSRLTPKGIIRSIHQTAEFYGKSGPRIYGEAILRLMNKGRQNRIPSLYSEVDSDDA